MTTLHPIGELLRSGVRPTDEETEHLRALGGFVAEMYGRFMGGHAEHLSSAADLWSGKLSKRLSAATGARWEEGLGLAELLLGAELSSFWQIAREGFAPGYEGFEGERPMLALYEEDKPAAEPELGDVAPRRRRGSLFGKNHPLAARARRAGGPARGEQARRTDLAKVALGEPGQDERARAAQQAVWSDGSRAELAVIQALTAGGLFVDDQLTRAVGPGVSGPVRSETARAAGLQPVFLDGVRIDARTPALASALARVDAVYSRADRMAPSGQTAAVSAARLDRLTASPRVSIDRGIGSGERPVFGFFDAVETTYLKLMEEAGSAPPAEGEVAAMGPRALSAQGGRSARLMPASALAARSRAQASLAPRDVQRPAAPLGAPVAGPRERAPLAPSLSLAEVVAGGPALRPYIGGVFGNGGAGRAETVAIAPAVSHGPDGLPVVRVQRAAMSAPRYAVVQAQAATSGRGMLADMAGAEPGLRAAGFELARAGTLGVATPESVRGGSAGAFAPVAAEMTPRSVVAGAAPMRWRLAADGGGDMPLGATFSRHEVFAGTRATQGAGDMRATRAGFSPVVAGAEAERPSELAQALDGMVWVTLPSDVQAPPSEAEALGLTAVPTRRAAMVPAGLALRSIAAGASGAVAGRIGAPTRGIDITGQPGSAGPSGIAITGQPGFAGPSGIAITGQPGFAGPSGIATSGQLGSAGPSGIATSGQLGSAGPSGIDITGQPSSAGPSGIDITGQPSSAGPSGIVQTARLTLTPAEMLRLGRSAEGIAGATAAPETGAERVAGAPIGSRGAALTRGAGGALGFDVGRLDALLRSGLVVTSAARGVGQAVDASARATVARPGAAAFGTEGASGEVSLAEMLGARAERPFEGAAPSLAARWVASALEAEGLGRGIRAARFIDGAVEAGYGRIESERELLAMVREPVAAADGEGTGEAVGAGARGPTLGRPEMRPAAVVAGGRGAIGIRGGQLGRTFDGGLDAEAEPPGSGSVRPALVQARAALSRAVVTARESRAVAALFETLAGRGESAAPAATNVPMGAGTRVAGSDEPVLGRLVQRMNEVRAEAPLAARWDVPQSILERVAGLGAAERREVARAFQASGWTPEELSLLRIQAPVGEDMAAPEASAAPVRRAARARMAGGEAARILSQAGGASGSVVQEAVTTAQVEAPGGLDRILAGSIGDAVQGAVPDAARAARMSRSLARIVTGTEGLGGPVDDKQAGALAPALARAQAASWLPLLGSGAEAGYFGGLGPRGVSRPMALASLHDAVGELVKMAEATVAQSDTPVALAARREVLRRAQVVGAQSAPGRAGRTTARAGEAEVSPAGDVAALPRRAAPEGRTLLDRLAGQAETALGAEGPISPRMVSPLTAEGGIGQPGLVDLAVPERAQRPMLIEEAERETLRLESDRDADALAVGEDDAATRAAPARSAGLERRLAEALALSTQGPAGIRRMLSMGGGHEDKATAQERALGAERRRRGEIDEAQLVRDTVLSGHAPEGVQIGLRALHDAAVVEEAQRSLSIMLGGVMAPEVMLGGLRSPELSAAIREVTRRRLSLGDDYTRIFTTLEDAGVDLAAARSSLAPVQRKGIDKASDGQIRSRIAEIATLPQQIEAAGLTTAGPTGQVTRSAVASEAPDREFLRMLVEDEGIQARMPAQVRGMGFKQKAGVLSAILRGAERAEVTALLEQAGGKEFAMAWLSRVDGSRSGIDFGMKETREAFGHTFGVRKNAMAGDSPIGSVSYVDTSVPAGGVEGGSARAASARGGAAGAGRGRAQDRSGLRSIAGTVKASTTGAVRPQHGASQAMRRTDWSFVETGSKASHTHADLGKLAAAIVGNAETAQRAPMPLVAPAVKAVAQTALRDDKNQGGATRTAPPTNQGSQSEARRGPVDAKMSEKAIEMLAIEMANRVARLMGLTNERRGIWS